MTEQEMREGFLQGRSLVQVQGSSTALEIAAVDRLHDEGLCYAEEWTYTHPRHPAERARNVRGLARSTLPPENLSVAEVLRQNGRLQNEPRMCEYCNQSRINACISSRAAENCPVRLNAIRASVT